MRAKEILNEMPYLHPGEMPRTILDNGISINALKREYTKLGSIDNLIAYIDSNYTHVIVIDPESIVVNDRVMQVLRLGFKDSPLIKFTNNFKNVKQVDTVAINRKYGSQEVASKLYKMLVDKGYTLVSDVTQFDPAQALWKKLAHDSQYKMFVADIDHGIFKDENGNNIVYNGTNIGDSEVWSGGSDYDGNYRVLILTK